MSKVKVHTITEFHQDYVKIKYYVNDHEVPGSVYQKVVETKETEEAFDAPIYEIVNKDE